MEYQDSEDAGKPLFTHKGYTEDGRSIIEFEMLTDQHQLLMEISKETGKTITELFEEMAMSLWNELVEAQPLYEELIDFRDNFGPGLED